MKKFIVILLSLATFTVNAKTVVSCVDADSFSPIHLYGNMSCESYEKKLESELYKQRKSAKLRVVVSDNNTMVMMGAYAIEGVEDEIYINGPIARTYSSGPKEGHLFGPENGESGLEIEYDSDQALFSVYGANAFIGELGSVDMLCYDAEMIMMRYGCER